jgi:4-aminobutyrate aminotransferase/(S)-3-amino-2-methylpropionate transaminase
MRETMEGWKTAWPIVGDVRGLGPMLLVEFVADRETKTPLTAAQVVGIVRYAAAHGVMLMRAGLFSNCIRFLPPLDIPLDMVREALDVVGQAIAAAAEEHEAQSKAMLAGAR